jgi:hypothetical protein
VLVSFGADVEVPAPAAPCMEGPHVACDVDVELGALCIGAGPVSDAGTLAAACDEDGAGSVASGDGAGPCGAVDPGVPGDGADPPAGSEPGTPGRGAGAPGSTVSSSAKSSKNEYEEAGVLVRAA